MNEVPRMQFLNIRWKIRIRINVTTMGTANKKQGAAAKQ